MRLKVLLNWFQVLIEWITTGLVEKAEIGCLKGNLEHNKAAGEVDPMDALSNTVHSVLLSSVQSFLNQYSSALILAAQW